MLPSLFKQQTKARPTALRQKGRQYHTNLHYYRLLVLTGIFIHRIITLGSHIYRTLFGVTPKLLAIILRDYINAVFWHVI